MPALIAVTVAAMVADWVAVARRRKPLEYAAKPAATALLVAAALLLDPADPVRRRWFVAALVLSLAGDVFLMLPADLFVPGLAAFLLAHLAYIAGFGFDGAGPWVAAVAVVSVLVGAPVVRSVPRELLAPVLVYMAVITVMVGCALGHGNALAIAGAAAFYASDAHIAWNRFVRPLWWAPVGIMVLYHLGQGLLVLSLRH